MKLYLRLLAFMKPYLPQLLLAIVCTLVASGANLYVPWIVKDIIDKVLTTKDMVMLNTISIGIVVVYFIRGVFFFGQNYLMAYVGQKIVVDLREQIYRHLQKLSLSFYERSRTGTIMSYITNDVAAVNSALADNSVELIYEGTTLIVSLAAIFYINWKLALLTLITMPLVAKTIQIIGGKLRKAGADVQDKAASITSVLQETISAARVVKSFVREEYEAKRFQKENYNNLKANMKTVQLSATLMPAIEFLASIGVTIIIWYGGQEVINGSLTAGALIAFLIYLVNMSNPMRRLSKVYSNIQKSLAAAQRVFDLLDTEPEVMDSPGAKPLPPVNGHVKFHNVSFEYSKGEPVLINVNLEARPGQMVAIVGPSGSGKTTIANLIPRFYDATEGSIAIDDIPIKSVTLNSLREQIGIVPQETVLFNGTVYENILYGRLDATEEEIITAAKAANAHQFIISMPEGYGTQIGERGAKLSGGQRQRIAIARAILKDPRILILDEATSALDTESEKLVQQALDKLMIGRTAFVIAHRLSTIQRADNIIVMEQGRIVERGTHDQLLQAGGIYSKLYQVQFKNSGQQVNTGSDLG